MDNKKRVIIVGSGPSGYSAAIYAARANLDVTIITGYQLGGQLTTTTEVDNWIGGREGLTGTDLMNDMKEHVLRFGVKFVEDEIIDVDLTQKPFKLIGDFDDEYECDALIIATGSSAKYLGIDSEKEFLGNGVSGCATCDGYFFKDLDVVVVGGGNTAVEEALYLSNTSSKVTLIHRGSKLRAEAILQDKLFEKENIEVLFNSEVEEFVGTTTGLSQVKLKDGKVIDTLGAFIAIGHTPNTAFLNGKIELSEDGHIVTYNGSQTSVEGVFACGDVVEGVYRQAIISAGTGCIASLDAQKYLENC